MGVHISKPFLFPLLFLLYRLRQNVPLTNDKAHSQIKSGRWVVLCPVLCGHNYFKFCEHQTSSSFWKDQLHRKSGKVSCNEEGGSKGGLWAKISLESRGEWSEIMARVEGNKRNRETQGCPLLTFIFNLSIT